MLLAKKELSIEVAEVDGVKIHDVDLTEAGEDKILQELTTNSSSADHQNARLMVADISRGCEWMGQENKPA